MKDQQEAKQREEKLMADLRAELYQEEVTAKARKRDREEQEKLAR